MATLRLFANLRESAGTESVDIDAPTVGDLLEAASDRFGDGFRAGLGASGVWVNGEVADAGTAITEADEVAVIPPVSGGTTRTTPSVDIAPSLLSLALVIALLAVAWADPSWFVIVAVGAVMAWVWDVSETAARTHDRFVVFPPLVTAAAAGALSYAYGFEGFAGSAAIGVFLSVTWPVFDSANRDFRTTAATAVVSLVAAFSAGGLVLIRLTGEYAVVAFVGITVVALLGAWAAGTYGQSIQSIDANVGALLGALVAGLITGLAVSELDIAAGLLGAVAIAAGIIAGRTFGSMLRTGSVVHTEHAPGSLALFDGAIVAAPLFWLVIWVFG